MQPVHQRPSAFAEPEFWLGHGRMNDSTSASAASQVKPGDMKQTEHSTSGGGAGP